MIEDIAVFRALLEHIPEYLYVFDATGRYTHVNRSGAALLGKTPEDIVGRTWREIGLPADREEEFAAERDAVMRSGVAVRRDVEFTTPSGSTFFDLLVVPIAHSGVLALSRDITERKRAEHHASFLTELQSRLQPLADPEEIVASAAQLLGVYLEVDRCAYVHVEPDEDHLTVRGDYTRGTFSIVGRYRLSDFGLAHSSALQDLPFVVYDIESDAGVADFRESYRQTDIAALVQVTLKKDGRLVAGMAVHQKIPRDWRPDEIALVQTVVNRCWESLVRASAIGEQRQSAERIARLHSLTSALTGARSEEDVARVVLREAIASTGARGGAVLRKTDQTLEVIVARGYEADSVERSSQLPLDAALPIAEAVRAGTTLLLDSRETLLRDFPQSDPPPGDGAWAAVPLVLGPLALGALHLSFASARVFDAYDSDFLTTFARQCAIAFDRAASYERERSAREAAEHANRAKDEFLAILSHELRTPMTAIMGWTSLLKIDLDRETVETAVGIIDSSVRAQARIVDDLLDVSRIVTGKLRLELAPISLIAPVTEAMQTVETTALGRGVRVELQTHGVPGLVTADASRLQQVFWNLLSNAVKFTPPGGLVRVDVRNQETSASVSITDSGPGIDPEFLPFVFDRFSQADRTSTRAHGGLGLGLAIAQHIVETHGGTISAVNRDEGGAILTVTLPVQSPGVPRQLELTRPT